MKVKADGKMPLIPAMLSAQLRYCRYHVRRKYRRHARQNLPVVSRVCRYSAEVPNGCTDLVDVDKDDRCLYWGA